MPTFKLTETQPATATWIHYVEAATEEEAIEKMYNGNTLSSYSTIEPDDTFVITLEDIEEVDDWPTE